MKPLGYYCIAKFCVLVYHIIRIRMKVAHIIV